MGRKTRPTVDELLASKKRDKRRKGLKLKRAASRQSLRTELKTKRVYANVVAINQRAPRVRGEDQPAGSVVFGMRTGLFGHPTTTVLRVPDEQIVGAVEDLKEMGEIVTKVGLLTLGALLNYDLAGGPEKMARRFAEWAGIDLTALDAAAEAEALEEAKRVLAATTQETADALALTEAEEAKDLPDGISIQSSGSQEVTPDATEAV